MRKIYLLFFLLLCSLVNCKSQPGYLSYPDYKTIYTEFFKNYSVKELEDISQLQFQKKPDGWHVVILKPGTVDTIIKDELLWSRSSKKIKQIRFQPAGSPYENRAYINKLDRDFNSTNFNLYPYYNYTGWDWDVIQEYKDRKNLPDSALYALGRTYSYFADNLLNNNSGFSDKRFRFVLHDGPDCLSPEQLEKYRKYHNLAIEKFKAVQKMNPNFMTIIGTIGVKLADEYMVSYLDMMIYQDEQEANKDLADNIYDSFYTSLAKNFLTSCDSNAILVTYGDNDTYPLLYVQAKYHFRMDVLIVNSSLLGTSRYINRMSKPFMRAGFLPLSIKPEQYADGTRDYLLYNSEHPNHPFNEDSSYALNEIMQFILSDDPANKMDLGSNKIYNYLPAKLFKFSVNNENVANSKILSENESNNILPELKWKFSGGSYMLKNQMILLNAILNNNWKRPICFCQGDYGGFLGLDNYLRLQGFVYELVPLKKPSALSYENAPINTSQMYNTVMNKFLWGNMHNGVPLDERKIAVAEMYKFMVYYLSKALVDENKKDSALKVLDLCMDSIPEKVCPFEFEDQGIVEAYYYANGFEKANLISRKLFKKYEDMLLKYTKPDEDNFSDQSATTDAIVLLLKLARYAKDYKQDQLYSECDKGLQTLIDKGIITKENMVDAGLE